MTSTLSLQMTLGYTHTEREAEDVNRQAESGRLSLTTRRTRKDGSLVDVQVLAAPIKVGGELVGLCAIYHDITALQKARRVADAATQTKSAFLATMSHEIRTPMNALMNDWSSVHANRPS